MRDRDHSRDGRVRWFGSTARLVLLGGLVTLVVAGAAFAATRGGTSANAVDTLVIANAVKVDSIDPAVNSANESIWLDQNIYNRLVQSNAAGTALQPDLAKSWTISKDGLTYPFHLRKARVSDGSPETA